MALLRTLGAATLAAATFGFSGPASAVDATYPPTEQPTFSVPQAPVEPGGVFTVRVGGFRPYSTVRFTVKTGGGSGGRSLLRFDVVVTAKADSDGFVTAKINLPEGVSGDVAVVASGVGPDGDPLTITRTVTVASSGSDDNDGSSSANSRDSSNDLPKTGGSLTPMYVGGGLLVLGAGFVVVARRRRGQHHEMTNA